MSGVSRRDLIKVGVGLVAGATGAGALIARTLDSRCSEDTPAQTEGPFRPIIGEPDRDLDLSNDGQAAGDVIAVTGTVLDQDCRPVANALIEVWQANALGRYIHPADTNPAPLDPHFQGWGLVATDGEGRFRFKTIKPGPYPAADGWTRPPHIHFTIRRRGFHELTTQMYFPGDPLNDVDRLLGAVPEEDRARVIASLEPAAGAAPTTYRFEVALKTV